MSFFTNLMSFDRRVFPVLSVLALGCIAIFIIHRQYSHGPVFMARVIGRDINLVIETLEKIDKQCSILSFDATQNRLDFFTVKSFVGSEVGAINLAYAHMWQGPYLHDNPQVQGKEYQVIKTKEGLFVVPGDGVTLPNGYVVEGKALLDQSMSQLTAPGGSLQFEGISFAKKLPFRIGDWPAPEMLKLGKDIEDMAEAISFS